MEFQNNDVEAVGMQKETGKGKVLHTCLVGRTRWCPKKQQRSGKLSGSALGAGSFMYAGRGKGRPGACERGAHGGPSQEERSGHH